MSKTEIAWSQHVWNPVRGCQRVSPGCGGGVKGPNGEQGGCYAETMAARIVRMGGYEWRGGQWAEDPEKTQNAAARASADRYRDLVRINKAGEARWTGKFAFDEGALSAPLRRKVPTMYFVNSMSDLFGEGLTNEQIAAVFGVMAACPRHTFQVLTKRADRMAEWFRWIESRDTGPHALCVLEALDYPLELDSPKGARNRLDAGPGWPWPLPNVWLGVSVERQEEADERIPHLLRCSAAVRWVSAEPLLGPVNLDEYLYQRESQYGGITAAPRNSIGVTDALDWVVTGGESGHGARPCDVQWLRQIGKHCRLAGTPWFNKQLGAFPLGVPSCIGCEGERFDGDVCERCGETVEIIDGRRVLHLKDKKGADPSEWPEDLRVREWPRGFTPPKTERKLPVVEGP